jgi:hypothetical protein
MEQGQSCKHDSGIHSSESCACGCTTPQRVNTPIFFNSITAGEDISEQIARLRRIRAAADELDV